jgi:hypothetical protein
MAPRGKQLSLLLIVVVVVAALPLTSWGRSRSLAGFQRNQQATGSLHLRGQGDPWVGTGVLVSRFGSTGRLGLVITNSHNVPRDPKRCYLKLGEHGEHRVRGLCSLLDNPNKEYALLVVKLPRAMKQAPVARIARVHDLAAATSARVYSVGAAKTGRNGSPGLAVRSGRIRSRGALHFVDPKDGRPFVPSLRYSYRSGSGFSGGGVYSDRTGELEALHWGNTKLLGFPIRSHAVPFDLILRDIQHNLGSIPYKKAKQAVQLLLSRAGISQADTTINHQHQHTFKDLNTISYRGSK